MESRSTTSLVWSTPMLEQTSKVGTGARVVDGGGEESPAWSQREREATRREAIRAKKGVKMTLEMRGC